MEVQANYLRQKSLNNYNEINSTSKKNKHLIKK